VLNKRRRSFYRLAYLALTSDQDAMIVKQRLDELGYGEGNNLMFDSRSAEGLERLPELAAKYSRRLIVSPVPRRYVLLA
jgi:hypothetical protein